jgi:hypothetical protein
MRLKHQNAGEAAHPVDVSEAPHELRKACRPNALGWRATFSEEFGSPRRIWDGISVRYNLLFLFA